LPYNAVHSLVASTPNMRLIGARRYKLDLAGRPKERDIALADFNEAQVQLYVQLLFFNFTAHVINDILRGLRAIC
jgi:hypothetical protein